MKKMLVKWLLIALCIVLSVPAAAETRQAVISLEGTEEAIVETLYTSSHGYSFWYPEARLEVYDGNKGIMEGTYVTALYSDDTMFISVVEEEDAAEYNEDIGIDIVQESAASRVQKDVYRDLENGRYFFLTVVAENGQYLIAVGEYAEEAAEGNAKFLQRVVDNITFGNAAGGGADPGQDPDVEPDVEPEQEGYLDLDLKNRAPGQWDEQDEDEGFAFVLTLEESGDMSLVFSAMDGSAEYTYKGSWSIELIPDYGGRMTLLFTSTDNPARAGSEYREECVYDAYTESWVENDSLIRYLLLTPPEADGFVSPFMDVLGYDNLALGRVQGPNMQVVKCKNFVSLRSERSTTAARLAKVPLGAKVLAFPEEGDANGFIACVYNGKAGYILAEYLKPIE